MKIISWNVNGLRAIHRKGCWPDILKENPYILCLQETKCSPDQLTEEVLNPFGYKSFFSSSKEKKGYSGVAVYSKLEPKKVEYGMGVSKFDNEGRILTLYFDNLVILNVYFPNGGGGPERLKYKLDFYNHFLKHIEKLRKKGLSIIFCGDVNAAHTEIDLARPKENEKNTGFLPEERAWIDKLISLDYIDVWRSFNPKKKEAYTYWDMKTRARDRNVGWRIDYFFISSDLKNNLKSSYIMDKFMGSDHCPLSLDIKF